MISSSASPSLDVSRRAGAIRIVSTQPHSRRNARGSIPSTQVTPPTLLPALPPDAYSCGCSLQTRAGRWMSQASPVTIAYCRWTCGNGSEVTITSSPVVQNPIADPSYLGVSACGARFMRHATEERPTGTAIPRSVSSDTWLLAAIIFSYSSLECVNCDQQN